MDFDAIPGAFLPVDQAIFTWLLKHQNAQPVSAGLVEIGSVSAKSAVLLGQFLKPDEVLTVCDPFKDEAEGEGETALPLGPISASQRDFETTYLRFHRTLPRIARGKSCDITRHVAPNSARIVHVKASKSFAAAQTSVQSAKVMLGENGVAIFDGFAEPNAIGTSAAIWEATFNKGLKPIAASPFKFYATWGDPAPYQKLARNEAAAERWLEVSETTQIHDMELLRIQRKP